MMSCCVNVYHCSNRVHAINHLAPRNHKYLESHGRVVNKYLQLFRMGNAVMGVVGVMVASFMAAGLDIGDHWKNLIVSAVVVFMFICGGNALNDYIDHEIDRTAHPERPIPSGRMERRSALHAALLMFVGSVVVSFLTFDMECIAVVIIAAVLMVAYEVALKQRGFVGNLTIAVLTGMLTTRVKQHKAAKAESEKERMRANLLRAVSHDLRTPLTTIYSASSTLLDKREQLTDQQRDLMLKSIQEDSEWLVRMVENLLSITRIGSERIEIAKTPVILDELIDSAMTKFHSRYPGQEVALELPEDMVAIPVDAILIEQVLINLLENAVLHAEGMTTLSLRVFTLGRQAIFEVADNGCGIREDRLSHIFSGSYEALESTPDGRKRNAGIGLSVCATIIKAHGGEITAENRRGGGALFRFTLGKEDITDDE